MLMGHLASGARSVPCSGRVEPAREWYFSNTMDAGPSRAPRRIDRWVPDMVGGRPHLPGAEPRACKHCQWMCGAGLPHLPCRQKGATVGSPGLLGPLALPTTSSVVSVAERHRRAFDVPWHRARRRGDTGGPGAHVGTCSPAPDPPHALPGPRLPRVAFRGGPMGAQRSRRIGPGSGATPRSAVGPARRAANRRPGTGNCRVPTPRPATRR